MKRTTTIIRIALGIALVFALSVPSVAFATTLHSAPFGAGQSDGARSDDGRAADVPDAAGAISGILEGVFEQLGSTLSDEAAQLEQERLAQCSKTLSYDPALIAQIGTQEQTGHTICCPSFSCAYADAVMDGTVHQHDYYTCSQCSWTDWGGGDSAFRSVGTDEQLLREAYDQISAGRPTVIHVAASYGEHWIALIGYENAVDPDHLSLSNFIALDPWNGAQVNAGASFALYGDGCEHISER